jgi:hypothetical protein
MVCRRIRGVLEALRCDRNSLIVIPPPAIARPLPTVAGWRGLLLPQENRYDHYEGTRLGTSHRPRWLLQLGRHSCPHSRYGHTGQIDVRLPCSNARPVAWSCPDDCPLGYIPSRFVPPLPAVPYRDPKTSAPTGCRGHAATEGRGLNPAPPYTPSPSRSALRCRADLFSAVAGWSGAARPIRCHAPPIAGVRRCLEVTIMSTTIVPPSPLAIAFKRAEHGARYSHGFWFVWIDKAGEPHAEKAAVDSLEHANANVDPTSKVRGVGNGSMNWSVYPANILPLWIGNARIGCL